MLLLQVLKVSALENKGIQDIWTAILEFDRKMKVHVHVTCI